MTPPKMRYRQVHLDFHTALECEDVGAQFDPETFAETVAMGHVDTINIFAKCHHGYSYYPTKVGTPHPTMTRDLLGEQIEALHRRDIRCPIYVSVMWDDLAGIQHPGWVVTNKDGTQRMRHPLSGEWGWTTMDVASPYRDYYMAQVEELLDNYEMDGLWADICFVVPNYSPWSQQRMRDAGVPLEDDRAVLAYADERMREFMGDVTSLLHGRKPDASVYYNGTTTPKMGTRVPYMTHIEVESLPTSEGVWGYLHYPIMARQARTYGVDVIGMTGRFHKSWADFGGLKTTDQLDYECGVILSGGGMICVGDQLHPNGVLDPAVYRLLQRSFSRVEALEPWLHESKPTAEVALLAWGIGGESEPGVGAHNPDTEGAAQMLLELGIQFDIVDANATVDAYEALFLPDDVRLSADEVAKLAAYLEQGGRLVLSGTAALDEDGQFQLDAVPVEYGEPSPTIPSYLRLDDLLADASELADDYDYVFYDQSHIVRAKAGTASHGELRRALFNRTWEHYTSHQHAPVGAALDAPVAVVSEQVLYFAAPLFRAYRDHDYWAYRAMVQSALTSFLPEQLIQQSGPGWIECTLHEQPAAPDRPARKIVHLVAYHPRRTLQPIQHVDQSAPVAGITVSVRADGWQPSRAYLAPDETALDWTLADGRIEIALPPIGPHTVLVLE